jgi:hypothetical protein
MWDFIDDAVSAVTGGLSAAADWTTQNPGAANLLGGALMAGGSYIENRENISNQKEMQQREWDRRDLYGGATTGDATQFGVTETLATNGPLTGNGVLANMKKRAV